MSGYRKCPDEKAKSAYRIGGILTSSLLCAGFLFMGFYDLSINLSHQLIVLEGFGLFLLLFGVVSLIFAILTYHSRLIEYNKDINKSEDGVEDIKKYSNEFENEKNAETTNLTKESK